MERSWGQHIATALLHRALHSLWPSPATIIHNLRTRVIPTIATVRSVNFSDSFSAALLTSFSLLTRHSVSRSFPKQHLFIFQPQPYLPRVVHHRFPKPIQ